MFFLEGDGLDQSKCIFEKKIEKNQIRSPRDFNLRAGICQFHQLAAAANLLTGVFKEKQTNQLFLCFFEIKNYSPGPRSTSTRF